MTSLSVLLKPITIDLKVSTHIYCIHLHIPSSYIFTYSIYILSAVAMLIFLTNVSRCNVSLSIKTILLPLLIANCATVCLSPLQFITLSCFLLVLALLITNVSCHTQQHVLPTVSLPPHKEEVTYPLPTVVYRMFDYTDVPEVN